MSDENKRIVARAFEVINKGETGALTEHLHEKFHDVFLDVAKRASAAFPDMKLAIEDMISENDKVVTRWTLHGSHRGQSRHSRLGSVKPTGRRVKVSGITIHRLENGRIVESWGVTEKLEALEQLGLVSDFARVATPQANQKVVEDALEEVFNNADEEALSRFFSPELSKVVQQGVRENREAFPDLKYTITHIEAGENEVQFAYTATGTNKGRFRGYQPTGQAASWEGRAVATLEAGKISHVHVVEDERLKLLKLGIEKILFRTVTGKWLTNVAGIDITMQLTQTGSNVTGTAKTNLGPDVFAVTGNVADPQVNLQSKLDATNVLVYNGSFADANTINGSYTLGTASGSATLRRS